MVPSIFPSAVQIELLSRLFHRDLSNPEHRTNLHLHYHLTYPGQAASQTDTAVSAPEDGSTVPQTVSFFEEDSSNVLFPKDPRVHKPITVEQMLTKKLRWVTLGGQYDWTAKEYPSGPRLHSLLILPSCCAQLSLKQKQRQPS